jgi:soluble lytic murein transglycosylase-like protein
MTKPSRVNYVSSVSFFTSLSFFNKITILDKNPRFSKGYGMTILKKTIATFCITILFPAALSATKVRYWNHFKEAGQRYGIDPVLLLAIANTESNVNPYCINKANRNKTIDVGVMQINSCHFKELRRYIGDLNLLYDPRLNINVGAWVLKKCINRFGLNWKAVDCYNKGAGNAHNNSAYARRVYSHYRKLKKVKR